MLKWFFPVGFEGNLSLLEICILFSRGRKNQMEADMEEVGVFPPQVLVCFFPIAIGPDLKGSPFRCCFWIGVSLDFPELARLLLCLAFLGLLCFH